MPTIRVNIKPEDELKIDHPARRPGYALRFTDKEKLDIKLLQPKSNDPVFVYRPGGLLLAVLLKRVIDPEVIGRAYGILSKVNGDPSNRPGIIGEGARQYGIRKDDKLSQRTGVPKIVLKKYGGKTDMFGYYRYNSPFRCQPTAWTTKEPKLYAESLEFIHTVNETYRTYLPNEYKRQMEYVDAIPANLKIEGTAFTTLYVLKNAPTATHTDDFDYPKAFGVMASLGKFRGGWLCFPRWRVAIDYQPGDLLLADVHQLHGNFPIYKGDKRVACIFFVRKGQHECPTAEARSAKAGA